MTEASGPPLAELTGPEQVADLADSTIMREDSMSSLSVGKFGECSGEEPPAGVE
jgi:hypothetical protein